MGNKHEIVWEDAPAVLDGITLFPITMAGYNDWQNCKHALLVRQATLPAKFVFMPYLSALHAVDMEYGTAFMLGILRALSLATRLPFKFFSLYANKDDKAKLECVLYNDGRTVFRVDNKNFPMLRKKIAEQNGEQLPDEGDNTELLEAEADIATAKSNANRVDYDVNTLVASVAYQCGIRKQDIRDWTIREFVETRNAIERDKNHLICGIAEKIPMFKWAKGNPCPSWCYDPIKEGCSALESMDSFIGRTGLNAL